MPDRRRNLEKIRCKTLAGSQEVDHLATVQCSGTATASRRMSGRGFLGMESASSIAARSRGRARARLRAVRLLHILDDGDGVVCLELACNLRDWCGSSASISSSRTQSFISASTSPSINREG